MVMAVMGPPGMTAKVSWRPSYPPDGRVMRTYTPLPMNNGATVVEMGPEHWEITLVRLEGSLKGFSRPAPVGGATSRQLDGSLSEEALAAEHGSADQDLVVGAVINLADSLGLDTVDDLKPRVIWGGTLMGQPAVYVHATLRTGGDFRVLSVDGRPLMWVVPRGAPDFPVAWVPNAGADNIDIQVLAGQGRVHGEVRRGGEILASAEIEPFSTDQIVVRDAAAWGELELVLRDSSGAILWTRALQSLPGPDLMGWGK
jgi:hypothetical protein